MVLSIEDKASDREKAAVLYGRAESRGQQATAFEKDGMIAWSARPVRGREPYGRS